MTGPRPPREPRFIAAPSGLPEDALSVPAALLDCGLPEPEAMRQVAQTAARLAAIGEIKAPSFS